MADELNRLRLELALATAAELLAERDRAQELCVALADAELEVFCQGTFTIVGATDRWLRGLPKGWREQLADIRARVTSRALARNRDPERVETGLAVGVDRARGEDSTVVAVLERQPSGEVHVLDVQFPRPSHPPELPPVAVRLNLKQAEAYRAELEARAMGEAKAQPRTKPCPACKATGRVPS